MDGSQDFRVDNPHTKPVVFWEKVIAEINGTDPDVIFLAEAFTRPAMMHTLGAVGFQQSYTYFTWRNTKQELTEYVTELSGTPPRTCGPTSS
ncbi:Alpha-1,4-glucan:maltose-1-phosphate maltosyltransferase OS=Streptomyces cyaneofuscatus OX=66883 GN=glgE PE=3 SV=1 [Streptomyces cyaneofuscatus]